MTIENNKIKILGEYAKWRTPQLNTGNVIDNFAFNCFPFYNLILDIDKWS
jgi:hypothetical protein